MREQVLVVGIGNELLGDEGLGVHVARSLLERPELPDCGLEVLEAGTSLLDALPEMARYQRVILVDAVVAGGEPGTIYRTRSVAPLLAAEMPPREISLHQWNLIEVFRVARTLNLTPAAVELIGAEPAQMGPGLELSPTLARSAARIVELLIAEHGGQTAPRAGSAGGADSTPSRPRRPGGGEDSQRVSVSITTPPAMRAAKL
ncbi:MAG: hydrogenase maturation protease [Thermoanaerobaculia bacterium]|nr:MAG: hydrogenase maturation protease [Thermoanaerobaculia bacterium]